MSDDLDDSPIRRLRERVLAPLPDEAPAPGRGPRHRSAIAPAFALAFVLTSMVLIVQRRSGPAENRVVTVSSRSAPEKLTACRPEVTTIVQPPPADTTCDIDTVPTPIVALPTPTIEPPAVVDREPPPVATNTHTAYADDRSKQPELTPSRYTPAVTVIPRPTPPVAQPVVKREEPEMPLLPDPPSVLVAVAQ